jgi:hypothetical protein
MQRVTTMATLLKRSDDSLYRVFIGADCASFVQRLTHEHCFQVIAILHAPSISQDAQEQLGSAIHALGTHRGNSWFEASLDQAVKVFLSVLPSETGEPPKLALDTPAHESTEDGVLLQPVEAHDISDEPPSARAVHGELEEPTNDESNDSLDMETDDPIWDYVQACSTREATKCTDIRAALEEKVGKVEAQKLLARAKPTVAQDASGKKNRVLKLGGSLLKLK